MREQTTNIGYVSIDNATIFEIEKFTILWNLFENAKCNYECSYGKIISMKATIEAQKKDAFEILANELNKRAARLGCSVDTYVETKIFPTSGARVSLVNRETHMPMVIEFINSGGKTGLVGALLAIYRIRNNMFHGLKGHKELDEQIELFKAMSGVLEESV